MPLPLLGGIVLRLVLHRQLRSYSGTGCSDRTQVGEGTREFRPRRMPPIQLVPAKAVAAKRVGGIQKKLGRLETRPRHHHGSTRPGEALDLQLLQAKEKRWSKCHYGAPWRRDEPGRTLSQPRAPSSASSARSWNIAGRCCTPNCTALLSF